MYPNHQVKAISASEPSVLYSPSDPGDGWHLFHSFCALADMTHLGWLWGASAPLSRKLFLCVAANFPPIIEFLCVTICLDVDRGGCLPDIPINLSDSSHSYSFIRWKTQLCEHSHGVKQHKRNFFFFFLTTWWSTQNCSITCSYTNFWALKFGQFIFTGEISRICCCCVIAAESSTLKSKYLRNLAPLSGRKL